MINCNQSGPILESKGMVAIFKKKGKEMLKKGKEMLKKGKMFD